MHSRYSFPTPTNRDSKESFADHAANIVGLLNKYIQPTGHGDSGGKEITKLELIRLILPRSIPKLHRTSTHERSRCFRSAIESITLDEVNAIPLPSWGPLPRREARHERRLLRILTNAPTAFKERLDVKIPKLLAEATAPGKRTHTCYNADTRGEIHLLLQALLKAVDDMVHILIDTPLDKNHTTTEDGQGKSKDEMRFPMMHLTFSMYFLWLLVYSPALDHHLERIEHHLEHHLHNRVVVERNGINLDLDVAGEGIDGLKAEWPAGAQSDRQDWMGLDLSRPSTVVVALMRWLRQQVAVVQSVNVLTRFKEDIGNLARSGSPPPSVSIKCVSVDRQGGSGQMQYDWRRLVTELAPYPSYSGECSGERAIQIVLETFKQFAAEDSQSFKGSVHCEAYLASLMRSEEVPEHVRREFEASRCFVFGSRYDIDHENDAGR